MRITTGLATSVAFRHVIEDGLSILEEKDIGPERRKYILEGLTNLMREASRGSDLANENSLVVSSNDRSAYESYSFLERYLRHKYDERLKGMLQAAEKAFDTLSRDAEIAEETREPAAKLLEDLLSSIRREGSTGIPSEPEEIKFAEKFRAVAH